MVKAHKTTFMSSTSVSYAPLDFIRSDVWGPLPYKQNGYNYYVLLTDDFSHFSLIYFLHTKDESPKIFSLFKVHIENLLQTTNKVLQTDGCTKYKLITHLYPQIT